MTNQQAAWDQARIQQLIDDGIEESLTLDYKAAGALEKTDAKKTEITKDVSALANSVGGTIIYGVSEYPAKAMSHLPEKIDPISRAKISKEWLEQVISNIRPRIDNLIIHAVPLIGIPDHVVYVVEVPPGETAHQAKDLKYYRRYNFESVPMADHEIRDVMGRIKHPNIEIDFKFVRSTVAQKYPFAIYGRKRNGDIVELVVTAINTGRILASYINCEISLPKVWLTDDPIDVMKRKPSHDEPHTIVRAANTVRDITGNDGFVAEYGAARYVPILPETGVEILRQQISSFLVVEQFDPTQEQGSISWILHADNAPSKRGQIAVKDIPVDNGCT